MRQWQCSHPLLTGFDEPREVDLGRPLHAEPLEARRAEQGELCRLPTVQGDRKPGDDRVEGRLCHK